MAWLQTSKSAVLLANLADAAGARDQAQIDREGVRLGHPQIDALFALQQPLQIPFHLGGAGIFRRRADCGETAGLHRVGTDGADAGDRLNGNEGLRQSAADQLSNGILKDLSF